MKWPVWREFISDLRTILFPPKVVITNNSGEDLAPTDYVVVESIEYDEKGNVNVKARRVTHHHFL